MTFKVIKNSSGKLLNAKEIINEIKIMAAQAVDVDKNFIEKLLTEKGDYKILFNEIKSLIDMFKKNINNSNYYRKELVYAPLEELNTIISYLSNNIEQYSINNIKQYSTNILNSFPIFVKTILDMSLIINKLIGTCNYIGAENNKPRAEINLLIKTKEKADLIHSMFRNVLDYLTEIQERNKNSVLQKGNIKELVQKVKR